jgi:hypothetical protein
MQNRRKYALFTAVITASLIVLGGGASPAFSEPPRRSTEECVQMEKLRVALEQRRTEIDNKMNNEATGRGVSRQPGIGPAYLALKKERDKLEEEKNRLDARWLQVCR